MACGEACKHLFISLALRHTIGEKRFQEQKGKEHIKTYRSWYWDLLLPGFTKALQDTIRRFSHNPCEGAAARHGCNGPITPRNCLLPSRPPHFQHNQLLWGTAEHVTAAGKALWEDEDSFNLIIFQPRSPSLKAQLDYTGKSSRIGNLRVIPSIILYIRLSSLPVTLFMLQ